MTIDDSDSDQQSELEPTEENQVNCFAIACNNMHRASSNMPIHVVTVYT